MNNNILIDYLPKTVEISGQEYEINTNFRNSILYELLMLDYSIPDRLKILGALRLYFNEVPLNIKKAMDALRWFYHCGKERSSKSEEPSAPVYSFEHDADYIYSAFLAQYNIDLNDTEYMHWWKFMALFKALKPDNEFVKITGYRSATIDNNMSKERRDFYNRMKKIHALPVPEGVREYDDAIEKALMNDGNVAGLL